MLKTNTACRGFTLIEVIIAMSIFATLAILSYSGLNSVILSKVRTEASLERLQELQMTMLTLTSDLQQLSTRNGHDSLGGTLLYLTTQNSDYIVEFTRSGWRNPANQIRSTLQRVAYNVEDDKLIRYYWPQIDRALDDQQVERTLMVNVENLEIRFLNPANEWQEDWPPISNTARNASIDPPSAIEITLKMNDWGEIKRVLKVSRK